MTDSRTPAARVAVEPQGEPSTVLHEVNGDTECDECGYISPAYHKSNCGWVQGDLGEPLPPAPDADALRALVALARNVSVETKHQERTGLNVWCAKCLAERVIALLDAREPA